jgi:hypothetical protein
MGDIDKPEVRSTVLKRHLAALDEELPGEAARRVREALPSGAAARIESAGRMDWLPAELLIGFIDAVHQELGADGAFRFWRRLALKSIELPIFKSFAQGAINLFRLSPGQALQLVPRVMQLVHRNIGTIAVEITGPNRVSMIHAGLPDTYLQSAGWRNSMTASYRATLEYLGQAGEVAIDEWAPAQRRASFAITWRERSR